MVAELYDSVFLRSLMLLKPNSLEGGKGGKEGMILTLMANTFHDSNIIVYKHENNDVRKMTGEKRQKKKEVCYRGSGTSLPWQLG